MGHNKNTQRGGTNMKGVSEVMLMHIYEAAERLKVAREEYVRMANDAEVAHYYAAAHALKLAAQEAIVAELRRELDALVDEVAELPMERTVIFRRLYAPGFREAVV